MKTFQAEVGVRSVEPDRHRNTRDIVSPWMGNSV